MKEIIPSIKAEMDGNGIKKAIEKINITNNCFFTMINKIDQLVETLAKKKKKKGEKWITHIGYGKGSNPADIKKIPQE